MFGKRIIMLRSEKGYTQAKLAKEIGISRAALSLYEIEKREPDIETLVKLASFFNVQVDYLIGVSSNGQEFRMGGNIKTIGDVIKHHRELNHFSQAELAEKIGLSQRNVSYYESGEHIPPADILKKLADIFGISVDELVGAKSKVKELSVADISSDVLIAELKSRGYKVFKEV